MRLAPSGFGPLVNAANIGSAPLAPQPAMAEAAVNGDDASSPAEVTLLDEQRTEADHHAQDSCGRPGMEKLWAHPGYRHFPPGPYR